MSEQNIYNMSQQELLEMLTPAPPEDKGFLGNLMTRRILNPLQERLGMRESLQDQMRREQIGASRFDAFKDMQEMQRDYQLRQQLIADGVDAVTANSLPIDKVAEALIARQQETSTNVYGDLVSNNPLSGAQQILAQAPSSVREYSFSRSQTQPPIRAQSYDEFMAKRNEGTQTKPAAIKTFEYLQTLNPGIANYTPDQKQDLLFKIIRQDDETAGLIAGAQQRARDGGITLTPAQRKVDEVFGNDFAVYNALGGAASGRKNRTELTELIGIMSDPANEGQITGRAVSLMPDVAKPALTLDIQNRVERIVTEDLRQTLGAQFTEQEAKLFIARSFNLALPEAVNVARLRRLRAAMSETHAAKKAAAEYYKKNGTVAGFDNFADISTYEAAMYEPGDYAHFTDQEIQAMIVEGQNDSSMSRSEFDVLLKVAEERRL